MHHRDHGAPAASSVRASELDDPAAGGSSAAAGDAGPIGLSGVDDCIWTEIIDADQGFVLLLNDDHVCVYASTRVRDMFGCEPEVFVGTRPEVNLAPDQLAQVWRTRAAVSAGARHVLTRVRWQARNGQERWFDTSSSLVRDPRTNAEYTAVHVRDVTHELELQAALTRSEQRHASLLESMDHAVLQLDDGLRIASFNQQALALLGRAAEQLLGRAGLEMIDLCDEEGRAVTDPMHPALGSRSGAARDDPWCTVAGPDGRRTLVRARLATYAGSRPGDGGHLLILREADRLGVAPSVPSRQQARGAAGLTAREGDVLDGLAAGGDVPTIARWLGISVHSVRGHVKSITAKLGVHSQLQAVIAATRRGMVDLADEPRTPSTGASGGSTGA